MRTSTSSKTLDIKRFFRNVDLHPLPPVCDLGGQGAVGEEPGYLISSGRDLGGVASGVVEELPDFGLEDP